MKKKSSGKSKKPQKTLSWPEVVAKLNIHGIPPREIGQMTLYQVYQALYALTDDLEERIQIAGGKIEDEEVEELTVQKLFSLGL